MKLRLSPRMLKAEPLRRCKLNECRAACCLHGVWVDRSEIRDILDHHTLIEPFMPEGFHNRQDWFDNRQEKDPHSLSGIVGHTTVVSNPEHYGGTACVFLRPDFKCALQVAGEKAGYHPWRFKPFYCILHPLDFDAQGQITLDETEAMLDEPGSCVRRSDKTTPLTDVFEEELAYLLGKNYRNHLPKKEG